MKVRESVFDSYSERKFYRALQTRWGEQFNIFAQLPFVKIVDIEGGKLTEKKQEFLFKTNVDYTFCEKQGDKPLLSIEFDGLGHGFSRMGEYIQFMPAEDPYRKLKLDLKLRIALELLYPFFVVSYDEVQPFDFDPELNLTILDGIIGQALAAKYLWKTMAEGVQQHEQEISNLPQVDRHEYIEDWALQLEVSAELEWDPIVRETCQLSKELMCEGEFVKSKSHGPLYDTKEQFRSGWWCSLRGDFGEVKRSVWVRNITGVGVDPLTIARNIAELLALREVRKKLLK